jgi:hypothetical protein
MAQVMAIARDPRLQWCRSWADSITETEIDATKVILIFLREVGWDYVQEYEIKSIGKYIDFYVKAPYEDGFIFFGIECKKQLSYDTNATEFAGYVEQAGAYARELQAPVFIGPLIDSFNLSDMYQGGPRLTSVAAASIFGGRFNVGIMGFSYSYSRLGIGTSTAIFTLRGSAFWKDGKFNPKRVNIVTTTGSKKTRTPLRIYRRKKHEENIAERRDR